MNVKSKSYVDLEDGFPVRFVMTVVGTQLPLKPGTTFSNDYEKIDGDVWLPFASEAEFRVEFAKLIKDAGHDESRCSNYRKFDAKSSIIYAP